MTTEGFSLKGLGTRGLPPRRQPNETDLTDPTRPNPATSDLTQPDDLSHQGNRNFTKLRKHPNSADLRSFRRASNDKKSKSANGWNDVTSFPGLYHLGDSDARRAQRRSHPQQLLCHTLPPEHPQQPNAESYQMLPSMPYRSSQVHHKPFFILGTNPQRNWRGFSFFWQDFQSQFRFPCGMVK